MTLLFEQLRRNEQRGSKPRCHLLSHGRSDDVAERLTALVEPFAKVTSGDCWMPQGFDRIEEATLPEAERLLATDVRLALQRWWLTKPISNSRTPNWDIASTCTI